MKTALLIRSVGGTILSVTLLVALTACDPPNAFYGPISIRSAGESVEFVVCAEFDLKSASASSRVEGGRWARIWEADAGEESIAAGSSGIFGEQPLGLAASLDDPEPGLAGTKIDILLLPADGVSSMSALFEVPESGLPTEEWLQRSGEITKEPCP